VSPFELQLALQHQPTWTGEYVLDFDEVLARGASKPPSDKDEEADPDRPMFSLISGRYRHAKRYGGELFYHVPPSLSFFFLPETLLQEKIRCLRCHHPRPLFSEIKMAQSRHSGIALQVRPVLFVRPTRRSG
jgi:hypothetical protein